MPRSWLPRFSFSSRVLAYCLDLGLESHLLFGHSSSSYVWRRSMIMMFPPHLVVPIPSAVINAAVSGMHLVTAARYLGGRLPCFPKAVCCHCWFLCLDKAAGLVALLYDHSLTFGDEINLICTAPRSFLNWFFLTNHYMVEVCLIAITSGAYIALPRICFHDAQSWTIRNVGIW